MTFRSFANWVVAACAVASALGCRPGGADASSEDTLANGIPKGDIRGTALVNQSLRTRLLDPQSPSTSRFTVETLAGPEVERLKAFLGQWVAAGTQTKFQGGEPTPFGVVLWHQVIARFAQGMAKVCDAPTSRDVQFEDGTTATLHPSVAPKIAKACTFEGDDAARKDAARALFHAVVDDELPDEDAAFADFFAGPDYAQATGKERVEAMFTAMLLNPHFLLSK